MVDITTDGISGRSQADVRGIRRFLLLLIVMGFVSLAVVADGTEQEQCKPFTFGVSAFGSCDWLGYLIRAGEEMPEDVVPFTAILTISDPEGVQPVFNDLRQTLTALGV